MDEEESKRGGSIQKIYKGSPVDLERDSHDSNSSGANDSVDGSVSSDGGDYTNLPIVLEHQGEAQEEANDEQGLAKVSPN